MRYMIRSLTGLLLTAALAACSTGAVAPTPLPSSPTTAPLASPVPPTAAPTEAPTDTPLPTPTDTPVPASTDTLQPPDTATPTPTETLMPTPTQFLPPTGGGASGGRITFDPGATTGSAQGQLAAGKSQRFVLKALKGQPMLVSLDSASQVTLAIAGAGGALLLKPEAKQTTWQGILPATQDYVLTATAGSQAANFALTVELPRRLTFASGAVSTVITGTAQAGPVVAYVLAARAGQTMTATITSPRSDVFLTIYGFTDGMPLVRSAMDAPSATITLPGTQDYIVKAVQTGDPRSNYSLSITIK